jgi:hypothetical protein
MWFRFYCPAQLPSRCEPGCMNKGELVERNFAKQNRLKLCFRPLFKRDLRNPKAFLNFIKQHGNHTFVVIIMLIQGVSTNQNNTALKSGLAWLHKDFRPRRVGLGWT